MKNKVFYIIFLCLFTMLLTSCNQPLQENRRVDKPISTQPDKVESPINSTWVEINNNWNISSQTQEVKEFYMESYVNMMNWMPAPRFSLSEIKVNSWDKVRLKIKATSWMHNFKLDEYNIFADTPIWEEVIVEFVVDKSWEFIYYCNMPWHRANWHWWTLIVNP